MYRALSYSARLDQPAAGKVLETANGGCLVDQKSGTENYKWSVRGKGDVQASWVSYGVNREVWWVLADLKKSCKSICRTSAAEESL